MELGLSPKTEALDRQSFADWLRGEGIDSRPLLWYMDYACRDDYAPLIRRRGPAFIISRRASLTRKGR